MHLESLIDNILFELFHENNVMINHQYFYTNFNNDFELIINTINLVNINGKYSLKNLCDDFVYRDLDKYNIKNRREIKNSMVKTTNTIYNLGILFNPNTESYECMEFYEKVCEVVSSMLMKYIMNE